MSETVEYYLMQLCNELAESALSQCSADIKQQSCNSILEALRTFKPWGQTKEGYTYWRNVYDSYKEGEIPTKPGQEIGEEYEITKELGMTEEEIDDVWKTEDLSTEPCLSSFEAITDIFHKASTDLIEYLSNLEQTLKQERESHKTVMEAQQEFLATKEKDFEAQLNAQHEQHTLTVKELKKQIEEQEQKYYLNEKEFMKGNSDLVATINDLRETLRNRDAELTAAAREKLRLLNDYNRWLALTGLGIFFAGILGLVVGIIL